MLARISGFVAVTLTAMLTLVGCAVTHVQRGVVTGVGPVGRSTYVIVEIKPSASPAAIWRCDTWRETSCALLHVGDKVSFTSTEGYSEIVNVVRTRQAAG